MEKLDSKLIDMRELYEELKCKGVNSDVVQFSDPFYEQTESHNLIGVANIFLDVLFDDVRLDYQTPIISQQVLDDDNADDSDDNEDDSEDDSEDDDVQL